MLIYKIDVIEMLKESGYNSTRILRENILSQSTMQKLRTGEMIGIKTLGQLCELLDMQPGTIIQYVENEPKKVQGKGETVDMGMTDSQFKAFIRFLIDALEEAKEEEGEKRDKKLDKILENLHSSLED